MRGIFYGYLALLKLPSDFSNQPPLTRYPFEVSYRFEGIFKSVGEIPTDPLYFSGGTITFTNE